MSDRRLYKVVPRDVWQGALESGVFSGSGLDLTDGFIHLSADDQVEETVSKHFSGQADLVLIQVDGESLGTALRWEPSRGGDLFPHVYGDIPIPSVIRQTDLPLGEDGTHRFPDDL